MMINHNIAALNAQRNIFSTNLRIDRSLERLSTGLKINSAADDAAGLAIAKKMAAQNAGLEVANQNSQDGLALYKIAEGALNQVNAMLTRMEELTTRAINSTLTDGDRGNIQDEINELLDQINLISKTTEYNTVKLLDGTLKPDIETIYEGGTTPDTAKIMKVPGTVKEGSYLFSVVSLATPALIHAEPAAGTVATVAAGVITVNGVDINIDQNSQLKEVVAQINAVNGQTGVVATYFDNGGAGPYQIDLVTGILDDDALNVPGATAQTANPPSGTVGYAKVGSEETVRISGNELILTELNIAPVDREANGTDAQANIDNVPMWSYGNTVRSTSEGARTNGLEINIDIHNGANGVILTTGVAMNPPNYSVDHTATAGDQIRFDVNTDNRMRLQVGANYNQQIYNGLPDISANLLGLSGSSKLRSLDDINVTNAEDANLSLKVIQAAIVDITSSRSEIGAKMNRLEYTVKTLQIQRENMTAAQARIEDADMAAEMTKFTKDQIMLQTGTAMLAQANSRPQQVLQLLQ